MARRSSYTRRATLPPSLDTRGRRNRREGRHRSLRNLVKRAIYLEGREKGESKVKVKK